MNRPAIFLLAVCFVTFAGCDSLESDPSLPVSPDPVETANHTAAARGAATDAPVEARGTVGDVVTLNGYTIEFDGSTTVGGGTQFTYTVTGVEPGPPALDWFFLENACGSAPTALEPSNAVGAAVVNGIDGIKWNASLPPGETRTYSYTFAGDVDVRVARAVISRGGVTATTGVPGPCGGHLISGSVVVNAATSSIGIGGVLVEAHDGTGRVSSDVTTASGSFEFLLASGDYTVQIPTVGEAINLILYASYDYAGGGAPPAALPVTLGGADVAGVVFGFNPDTGQIITDLSEGGQYQTSAQGVRFWKDAVRNAARGRSTANPDGGDPLSPNVIRSHLDAIFSAAGEGEEGYYLLADPFVLVGTDPFAYAADLLSRPIRTDVEIVSQNLFAMQLNLMQGWGTGDQNYDDALMSYLEEWVRTNSGSARASALSLSGNAVKAGGGGGGTIEEVTITTTYLGGGGGGTIEE